MRDKGNRTWEMGKGYLSWHGSKGLPLDREKTERTHRKMSVYKGKEETPC